MAYTEDTKQISYTERDFLGIRNELIRLTNTYYPNLIKNTNDGSIYSVFLDLNAAVADNLNYQIDRSLQETVLQFAQERSSLYNIARTYGLKIPGNRPSVALCDFSIIVPAFGDKEDETYLGFLRRGSQVRGAGQVFELANDCDFSSPYSVDGVPNRTKIPNVDSNGIITNYTITKREVVINGVTKIFKKAITDVDSKPFFKIFLPDRNVLGVTSIIEKSGLGYSTLPSDLEFLTTSTDRYYEVDSLAEKEIFVIDPSAPSDDPGLKPGKYIKTGKRFISEFTPEGFFFLTFGGGNTTSQDLLNSFSKYGTPINASKYFNNISLGSAVRPNTTLFIQYRVGGGKASNVGAGSITSIGQVDFVVSGPAPAINTRVKNSLKVTNVTAAIGGDDLMPTEEIRNYISFNFAAQNRGVTLNDYISKVRLMPAQFGAAAKVGAIEVENKVKVNVLSYTPTGELTSAVSSTLKQNIAEYLSNYRMLNDYVEIGSGAVIDLGIDVDILIQNMVSQGEIVNNVIQQITDFFKPENNEMGTKLNMSELGSKIVSQPGVTNVVDMRVFNKVGGQYSNSKVTQAFLPNTENQINLVDGCIIFQPDEIAQIRFPSKDIKIRVKQTDNSVYA
tara:strand:+ start:607 stop:2460 length:1854 start_codon:yes stop_codon:yes gene_type:complete